MPIYTYECLECHHKFEQQKKMDDRDNLTGMSCPACSAETLKRTWQQSVGLAFKGGGWYKDGYSSPGAAPSPKPSENTSGTVSSGPAPPPPSGL